MSRSSRKSHHSATPPPRLRHARQIFLTVTVAGIAFVLVVGHEVVLPFVFAALIGYVLFPAVRFVERSRIPRWLAILVVYAAAVGSVAGFVAVVVPRLGDEVKTLSTELPRLTARIRDDYLPAVDARLNRLTGHQAAPAPVEARPPIVLKPREDGSYTIELQDELHIAPGGDGSYVVGPPRRAEDFSSAAVLQSAFDKAVAWAQKNSLELLAFGRAIVSGVSRGVFYFFITLMIAGYMMFTWESIHGFIREMWPRYRRPAFDRFLHRLDRGLAGVVRGQLMICLVNGVLSAIGFWFFELKYWPILALIAGVMSVIPIFGSILSTIPAVAIGLTQSFGIALSVLIWIVAIHQLEANFLNPKIIGDSAKIHPVLVVFALLFGEHFFQITGALLAVPALAVVQSVFLHFRESILGLPEPATAGVPSLRAAPLPEVVAPDEAGDPPPDLGASPESAHDVGGDRITELDASDEVETQLVQTRRSPSEIPEATDPDPEARRSPEDEGAAPKKKRELTTTMKSQPK